MDNILFKKCPKIHCGHKFSGKDKRKDEFTDVSASDGIYHITLHLWTSYERWSRNNANLIRFSRVYCIYKNYNILEFSDIAMDGYFFKEAVL